MALPQKIKRLFIFFSLPSCFLIASSAITVATISNFNVLSTDSANYLILFSCLLVSLGGTLICSPLALAAFIHLKLNYAHLMQKNIAILVWANGIGLAIICAFAFTHWVVLGKL